MTTTAMAAKSSLTQRLVSAAIGLPVLVGVCLWEVIPFVLLTVVLALVARCEITRAYEQRGIRPSAVLSLMGALLPGMVLFLPSPFEWSATEAAAIPANPLPFLLLLACGLIAASLWETAAASHVSHIHTGRNIAYGLLCGAYVSLFSGVSLRRICPWRGPGGALFPLANGASLTPLTMACTMAGDSAAYFLGRAAGRHKLAEGLSPRKSTEGLLGGMVANILVGAAAGYIHPVRSAGRRGGGAAGTAGRPVQIRPQARNRHQGLRLRHSGARWGSGPLRQPSLYRSGRTAAGESLRAIESAYQRSENRNAPAEETPPCHLPGCFD